jgi:hypothetical protein
VEIHKKLANIPLIAPAWWFFDNQWEEAMKKEFEYRNLAEKEIDLKQLQDLALQEYVKACMAADHSLSDLEAWTNQGWEILWKARVTLGAIAITLGPEHPLLKIPLPNIEGKVVMDGQHSLERWIAAIADLAELEGIKPVERPPFHKKEGCKCVHCSELEK